MSQLAIHFLGPPRIERDGVALTLDRRKAIALLAYLALRERAHTRDALATLFWPGYDQATSRGNLRRTLSVLTGALDTDRIKADRELIEMTSGDCVWIDVAHSRRCLAACCTHGHAEDAVCPACVDPLTAAIAVYADDFLAGFTLPDAPEFDQWQILQTESLRREFASALKRLALCYARRGEPEAGLDAARRWLALDPLHESAHRMLMRLHTWAGDRAAALRQYAECSRVLAAELNLSPSAETVELQQAILQNRLALPEPFPALAPPATQPVSVSGQAKLAPPAPAPAALSGELRLVTVVCAGLSASLELTADAGPEELAGQAERLVALLVEVLARYGAKVEPYLADGVVATFGLEQMHEDDAERAVLAALAARGSASQAGLPLSVGIQTGQVYISHSNDGPTALGPVVNLAARLRDLASEAEILLGETTHRQTYLAVHDERRMASIPGLTKPAPIYSALRPRRQPRKSRGVEGMAAELVGRDEELGRLKAAADALSAGKGCVVTLTGEAGLGKSRMLAELREYVDVHHSGMAWLEGRCLEMTSATAYGPFVDLLRVYFALQVEAGADLAPRVRAELDHLTALGHLTPEQCEEIGPLLGNLLGLHYGDGWDDRLRMADPKQIQVRTFAAVRDLLAALAARRPLVMALEDLHWADSLSLDLVGELMPLARKAPLLLCYIYRPTPDHRSRQLPAVAARRCPGRHVEITLHGLPTASIRRLVTGLLGADLEARVLDQVEARAQGNPFFTEEMVRALMESDALIRDGLTWRARAAARPETIPATIQSVVLSRYDRLTLAHKQVLRQAATIGCIFPLAVLARLAQQVDSEAVLDALEEHGLVYLERSLPEVEYSFGHVLIQEAIYATLPRAERTRQHRQVAEVMESLYGESLPDHYERLAHHYDRSDAADKAIEYLLLAGEKARRAYLGEDALAYFRRALELMDAKPHAKGSPDAGRLEALRGMGRIYFALGRAQDSEHYLVQAIDVGRELRIPVQDLLHIYCWLCETFYWQGRFGDMLCLAEEGLALVGENDQSVGAALMNCDISGAYFEQAGRKSDAAAARNSIFIHNLPYTEDLRAVYWSDAFRYHLGARRVAEARRRAALSLDKARAAHDLCGQADLLWLDGVICRAVGDLSKAISQLQRSLELFTRSGLSFQAGAVTAYLASSYLSYGELDEARASLFTNVLTDSTEPEQNSIGPDGPSPLAETTAVELLACEGKIAEAATTMQHYLNPSQSGAGASTLTMFNLVLGRLSLMLGNRVVARERLNAALHASALVDWRPVVAGCVHLPSYRNPLADVLSGLEAAHENLTDFRAECDAFRIQHPQVETQGLVQWYLTPVEVVSEPGAVSATDWGNGWEWADPFGDCTYAMADELEICAANGRDLWFVNWSAPRLLQPVRGDFAAQTVCLPALSDRPAIGGLVLWRDEQNYLRLDRGLRGPHEIAFEGCVANRDVIIGRGMLREAGERIRLRLERQGARVRALCSADGATWYTAGETDFPLEDPVQIGVHALGCINRIIYPGAYREGTAIRFESWQLWRATR